MKLNDEARIGLMVTLSFTIFIVIVGLLAKYNLSRTGYELKIYFGFLDGLSEGAPVKIGGGIKIGQVNHISQSGEKTIVTVWIDNDYTLLKSSKFAIFTTGMIGSKYINVFIPPSSEVDDFLRHGDIVYGTDPASLDQMMLIFQSFMQDQSGGELLAEIFLNSKNFVENLNRISGENRDDIRSAVLSARATIALLSVKSEILMNNLNKLSGNAADLSEQNKEEISIALRNISELSGNLNKIVYRLENGKGTLGRLLTDEEIYLNLKDASISAKDLFESLRQDPSKIFFKAK